MREIDNKNINSLNFKGIQKVSNDAQPRQEQTPAAQSEPAKEINDLANVPEASLGKSQISSDSVESDMKFMEKNPALVQKLNEAIDKYAQEHSEEDTLKMLEKMHQEFVKK